MLYTHAPSTCPTGSKPALRIAANSSVDSADPQVPLPRISDIRAWAAGGRALSSVTACPFRLLDAAPTLPFRAGRPGRGPAGGQGRSWREAGSRTARGTGQVPALSLSRPTP